MSYIIDDTPVEVFKEDGTSIDSSFIGGTKTQDPAEVDKILTNQSFSGRRETRKFTHGQEYVVYPAVLMVEGVHHAVNGNPVYYPGSVLQKTAHLWGGTPVSIGHPQANGQYVSCSCKDVQDKWKAGFVSNPRYKSGKLLADLWLTPGKADKIRPGIMATLESGEAMEVSTGVMINGDGVPGNWNGEDFTQTINGLVPDHLALLPNDKGACSWEDGCGIRANQGESDRCESPYVAPTLF